MRPASSEAQEDAEVAVEHQEQGEAVLEEE